MKNHHTIILFVHDLLSNEFPIEYAEPVYRWRSRLSSWYLTMHARLFSSRECRRCLRVPKFSYICCSCFPSHLPGLEMLESSAGLKRNEISGQRKFLPFLWRNNVGALASNDRRVHQQRSRKTRACVRARLFERILLLLFSPVFAYVYECLLRLSSCEVDAHILRKGVGKSCSWL